MPKKSPSGSVPPAHRGRIQAQGPDTEKSESWAQDDPPSKSDMIGRLEELWRRLSLQQQDEREECYQKARKWIEQAPGAGIDGRVKMTFRNRKKKGGVRIDIEIETGKACVDNN